MNPDCRDGKHRACAGDGWNWITDEPAACPCSCHARETATPVVRRLGSLAVEFDNVAAYYARRGHLSEHNQLVHAEARRAAGQLRMVSDRITIGWYTQQQGMDWLRAAWRILTAIGRRHIA